MVWWVVANIHPEYHKQSKLMIQLVLNAFRLGKEICKSCESYSSNSVDHILFNCDLLQERRLVLWHNVEEACPYQLCQAMQHMSSVDLCKFILNGLNVPFTPDWNELYCCILNFTYEIYYMYYNASK